MDVASPVTQTTQNTVIHSSVQHKDPVQTGPQLSIADCLCRQNNKVNEDEEMLGKGISIIVIGTCTGITDCMTAEEMWLATINDKNKGMLSNYVLHGWPSTKLGVQKRNTVILVF